MKYLLVFNELSGGVRSQQRRQLFIQEIQDKILKDPFFYTKEVCCLSIVNPYFDNQELIDLIKEKSITHLILAGGDGTYQRILDFFYQKDIFLLRKLVFGFIPLGSGNGLARHLRMPFSATRYLKKIKQNKIEKIDAFLVNERIFCIHNIGSGFDADVIRLFNKQKKRGSWLYTRLVLKQLFRIEKYSYRIESDKGTYRLEAALVLISNTNQFGVDFKMTPLALLSDGLLDVLIVPYQSTYRLTLQLIRFFLTPRFCYEPFDDQLLYFQTKQISVENLSHASVHIGGEVYDDPFNKFTCRVLNGFVSCLV